MGYRSISTSLFHRWAHPLLVLVLVWMGHDIHAEAVFRCEDRRGHVAYQDHPCAHGQRATEVAIAPPPPYAPSPVYAVPIERRGSASVAHRAPAEVMSWECVAANGERFYRHSRCPAGIKDAAGRDRGRGGAQAARVEAHALPRREVCRRMRAPASIGRAGHERDETVSTYERNAGRDPCRRY